MERVQLHRVSGDGGSSGKPGLPRAPALFHHIADVLYTTATTIRTQGWPRSSLYITKKYEELKETHKAWPDRCVLMRAYVCMCVCACLFVIFLL
jgi:hypothetical protein